MAFDFYMQSFIVGKYTTRNCAPLSVWLIFLTPVCVTESCGLCDSEGISARLLVQLKCLRISFSGEPRGQGGNSRTIEILQGTPNTNFFNVIKVKEDIVGEGAFCTSSVSLRKLSCILSRQTITLINSLITSIAQDPL